MKATEAKLLDFLKKSPQFVIHIYQRTYSWTDRECSQLWGDIMRTGRDDDIAAHFVGSIVYIEKGLYQVTSQSPLLVIDGQQRLATVMLILEALARHLGESEPLDGFSAKKLRNNYLLDPLEEGERGFKLLLTQTDKSTMLALMQQKDPPAGKSVRVSENFVYFEEQVRALGADLTPLRKGLAKLVIVDIALSRDQDNPQLIFESMNSTGRELSQADLIRNFVLMGLEPSHQTRIYEDHWHPMEVAFAQKADGTHFDGFMRHYLTLKTGEIPNVREVYEAFKDYATNRKVAGSGVDALIAEIHTFANYFCAMALEKEQDPELSAAFQDLRELKVDVAYPFLLELYDDYAEGILSKPDLVRAVRLVEAYVFRRAAADGLAYRFGPRSARIAHALALLAVSVRSPRAFELAEQKPTSSVSSPGGSNGFRGNRVLGVPSKAQLLGVRRQDGPQEEVPRVYDCIAEVALGTISPIRANFQKYGFPTPNKHAKSMR